MNTKTKWILGVVILVLAVWIIVSQLGVGANKGEIRIGMISILSGEYSVVGENFRNGALLAVEHYNAAHPDNPVTFIPEDDGFDSKKALSAYQKLTGIDRINALINVSTPSIGAIYDLVTKTDIPVIQGGEQPAEPTDDNVFQILPGNIEAERQLGVYLKAQGFSAPAIVYTQNDAIIRFKNAVIEGYGGQVKEFPISATEKDYRTHVLKTPAANADVVVLLMFPEPGALFLQEYLKQQQKLPQLAFDANFQSGFLDYQRILGNLNVLNGSIVSAIVTVVSALFKNDYKQRFQADPGFMSDVGYDATNLLIETYSSDGAKWINNVKKASFKGVGGTVQFDSIGVRKPQVEMVRIVNGSLPN